MYPLSIPYPDKQDIDVSKTMVEKVHYNLVDSVILLFFFPFFFKFYNIVYVVIKELNKQHKNLYWN